MSNDDQQRKLEKIWEEIEKIESNDESKTYHLLQLLDGATEEIHDSIVERFSRAVIDGNNNNLVSLDLPPRNMKESHFEKIAEAINESQIKVLRMGPMSFPVRSNDDAGPGLRVLFDGLTGERIEEISFHFAEGVPSSETSLSMIRFLCRCTAIQKFDVAFSDLAISSSGSFLSSTKMTLEQIFTQTQQVMEEGDTSHRYQLAEIHTVKVKSHAFVADGVAQLPHGTRVAVSVSLFSLRPDENAQLWEEVKHLLFQNTVASYAHFQDGRTPLALWPHLMERMDALQTGQTESPTFYLSIKHQLMRQQMALWKRE